MSTFESPRGAQQRQERERHLNKGERETFNALKGPEANLDELRAEVDKMGPDHGRRARMAKSGGVAETWGIVKETDNGPAADGLRRVFANPEIARAFLLDPKATGDILKEKFPGYKSQIEAAQTHTTKQVNGKLVGELNRESPLYKAIESEGPNGPTAKSIRALVNRLNPNKREVDVIDAIAADIKVRELEGQTVHGVRNQRQHDRDLESAEKHLNRQLRELGRNAESRKADKNVDTVIRVLRGGQTMIDGPDMPVPVAPVTPTPAPAVDPSTSQPTTQAATPSLERRVAMSDLRNDVLDVLEEKKLPRANRQEFERAVKALQKNETDPMPSPDQVVEKIEALRKEDLAKVEAEKKAQEERERPAKELKAAQEKAVQEQKKRLLNEEVNNRVGLLEQGIIGAGTNVDKIREAITGLDPSTERGKQVRDAILKEWQNKHGESLGESLYSDQRFGVLGIPDDIRSVFGIPSRSQAVKGTLKSLLKNALE